MIKMKEIYIIAEAGISHNGKLKIAKKLVDVASDAGANAVKFQTFWDINRLKKYELPKGDWYTLEQYCIYKDIQFLSTPHTFKAIHFLEDMVTMYKVASTYLSNINFLKEIARKNKPILLSVGSLIHDNGMASKEEIRNALGFIPNAEVILMHCVSKYPCNDPRFDMMYRLKEFNKTIGISDHSKQIKIPRASYIEKHIKLDDNCLDSDVSLNPEEFKQFVNYVRGQK